MVMEGKSDHKYSVNVINACVTQASVLDRTLFLLYINDLPENVICNIGIYADNTTVKFDQTSNLW